MNKIFLVFLVIVFCGLQISFSQETQKDRGKFVDGKNEFWEKIKSESGKLK